MTHPFLSEPIFQPPKNPLDAFDPNTASEAWATYCPDRSPAWKTHAKRGYALNALHRVANRGGILFVSRHGAWQEVVRFNPPGFLQPRCGLCNQPLLVDEKKHMRQADGSWAKTKTGRKIVKAKQVLQRHHGKLVEPLSVLVLCERCSRGY